MLKVLFGVEEEEEVIRITKKKIGDFPDDEFYWKSREYDLNTDETFINLLRKIDRCDVPMPNVARDLVTGRTHSFDKVSTGVYAVWLASKDKDAEYIYESQWLGENCYQPLIDLSKTMDIYIWDNSDMLYHAEPSLTGEIEDLKTGRVISVDNEGAIEYLVEMGY